DLLLPALIAIMRERREFLKLSQNDLGMASGIHRSYIGDFESAKRNISVKNLSRLAVGLETTSSKLLRMAEQRVADPSAKISMAALDNK
ncbi:MAG: helix-turn-helix transcriptional regulator, partial [Cyanobacteria bacterium SZAS LIN-5]|nr:helix-turn-helix transcriptional regulator [Cyanobacteria bacterium SZAS LIN-5]